MKKLASILLIVILCVALAVPALAAELPSDLVASQEPIGEVTFEDYGGKTQTALVFPAGTVIALDPEGMLLQFNSIYNAQNPMENLGIDVWSAKEFTPQPGIIYFVETFEGSSFTGDFCYLTVEGGTPAPSEPAESEAPVESAPAESEAPAETAAPVESESPAASESVAPSQPPAETDPVESETPEVTQPAESEAPSESAPAEPEAPAETAPVEGGASTEPDISAGKTESPDVQTPVTTTGSAAGVPIGVIVAVVAVVVIAAVAVVVLKKKK